jgi:hypothetical protein
MKKIIVFVSAIIVLTVTPLLAVIGPIPIDESNVLPDGQSYGTVTVTLLPGFCPGPYDGVQIVVDANQSLLTPLSNFGIQKFGFNYNGSPADLTVTGPTGWSINMGGTMSEFGVFMEEPTGGGQTRHDPLTVQVCNCCKDMMEGDVIVKNNLGYTFAAHIADFSFPGFSGTSSAFFATMKTTLIELASFTAQAGKGRVKLEWVTESEIDNAGFYIWRSTEENGEYVRLNDEIIPAQGSPGQGATYDFTDKTAKNRNTYFYKLQDMDVYGNSTFNGPVSATPRFILGIFNK